MTGSARRFTARILAPLALVVPLALATPAAGASASQQVIFANLQSVSCPAANDCMAVGSFLGQIPGTSAFQNFTLAEAWNGSTWTILPTPSPRLPGGGALLNSVSCTSTTSCIAVGETQVFHEPGGFEILHPFAESWNGTKWSVAGPPKLTNTAATLNGVSCTSPSSCMAVGSQGPPHNPTLFTLAEQWNGTAWREATTPPPLTPGGTALIAVSCTGSSACMAGGYFGFSIGFGTSLTLAEQWNGTKWQIRTTPNPGSSGSFGGVACTSATACLATGGHRTPNANDVTLAERWNGTGWKALPTPNPRGFGVADLGGISCPAAASCMSVGSSSDPTGESTFNLAEAWNGTSWTILRTPSPGSTNNGLNGVSCTSPSNCMAVGTFMGFGNGMTLAESWNGTRWSVVKTPRP